MVLYEWEKEVFFPDISKWESHTITIIVTVLLVSVLTWFMLQKQNELICEIQKQKRKAEINQKHLVSIIESTDDAIFSINANGLVISWNRGASLIFGLSADQILYKPANTLIPPEVPDRFMDLIANTQFKSNIYHYEGIFLKQNGDRIHLSCTTSALPDIPGLSGSIAIIARDISDHIAKEEMLKMLSIKQQLLSAITRHDINNNLQAAIGYLSILKDETTDPDSLRIITKIEYQSQIIKEQIEFMREYESLGVKTPVWQSAHDIFKRAIQHFSKDPAFYQISLQSLEVYADPLIDKVIYNLCDNAFRYGRKLSYIRSSFEIREGICYWIVEDDGIGIQDDLKEKIFEKGFGQTSGLGLYYIREILSITQISIQETGILEKGARFEMVIPTGFWRIVHPTR